METNRDRSRALLKGWEILSDSEPSSFERFVKAVDAYESDVRERDLDRQYAYGQARARQLREGRRRLSDSTSTATSRRSKAMNREQVDALLSKSTDPNARVLLALRRGDPKTIRAHRVAIHGRCENGCSFWQCGREKGHAGPCAPEEV